MQDIEQGVSMCDSYWYNHGIHFGYPECCIEAFINKRDNLAEHSFFTGSGFRPCKTCATKEPSELIKIINKNRKDPIPFVWKEYNIFEMLEDHEYVTFINAQNKNMVRNINE